MPMLVKLKHVPYCFAVCGGVLFEPSLPAPLPSTKESLDFICGGEGLYRGIQWANRIVPTAETTSKESKRRCKRGRTGLTPVAEAKLASQPDANMDVDRSGSPPMSSDRELAAQPETKGAGNSGSPHPASEATLAAPPDAKETAINSV